jgi:hypothetical protein
LGIEPGNRSYDSLLNDSVLNDSVLNDSLLNDSLLNDSLLNDSLLNDSSGRAASRLGALAPQTTTLALGQPSPDAELLAVHQCVLEAVHAHDATTAHFLRLSSGGTSLGEEKIGIDAEAVRLVLPVPLRLSVQFDVHDGRPPCAWARSVCRLLRLTCNYMGVIVHYHITFAQGGISRAV